MHFSKIGVVGSKWCNMGAPGSFSFHARKGKCCMFLRMWKVCVEQGRDLNCSTVRTGGEQETNVQLLHKFYLTFMHTHRYWKFYNTPDKARLLTPSGSLTGAKRGGGGENCHCQIDAQVNKRVMALYRRAASTWRLGDQTWPQIWN